MTVVNGRLTFEEALGRSEGGVFAAQGFLQAAHAAAAYAENKPLRTVKRKFLRLYCAFLQIELMKR